METNQNLQKSTEMEPIKIDQNTEGKRGRKLEWASFYFKKPGRVRAEHIRFEEDFMSLFVFHICQLKWKFC